MLDKILRASLTITIIYYFPLLLSRAAEAAAAYCVGVVAIGGEVFVEYALCHALAFGQSYVAVCRIKQPQHDVPFIVFVVVVVGVDNAHVVHQCQTFFNSDATADMHAKKLVVLHVSFYTGRHHFQFVRFQSYVLRKVNIVASRHFGFAFRHRKVNICVSCNFFKTANFHITPRYKKSRRKLIQRDLVFT